MTFPTFLPIFLGSASPVGAGGGLPVTWLDGRVDSRLRTFLRVMRRILVGHRNRNGPRTLLWGTSESTLTAAELTPSITTLWDLIVKKVLIQLFSIPSIPIWSSFNKSHSWGTILKAFEKSYISILVWSLLSNTWRISWIVIKRWVSHE